LTETDDSTLAPMAIPDADLQGQKESLSDSLASCDHEPNGNKKSRKTNVLQL
jgi:hypothetical protein